MEYRHTLKPFARKYIILVLATAAFRTVLLGCSYQITDGSNLVALLFLIYLYLFIFSLFLASLLFALSFSFSVHYTNILISLNDNRCQEKKEK